MRSRSWADLGLTEDEWRECRRAALEMTLASGELVPARQVAVEYVRARDSDARLLARAMIDERWA